MVVSMIVENNISPTITILTRKMLTEDYEVGQIGQQVHSGAPKYVHSLPYCTFSTSYVLVFTVYWIRVGSMRKAHHIQEIVPPGTKAFPAVATSPTKVSEPIKAVKPVRGPNTSHGHEALPHHARPLGVSEK